MRKIIHSSFELDLSPFKISDTEENSWFFDTFFTKYSFPFDIDLENDLEIASSFINMFNTTGITYFELKYCHQNKIEDAIFEIEQQQQKLSCSLRFGIEALPSFGKKLSELSLQKLQFHQGQTIYNHAESVISQTWPAVNYNFPQIHIDKIEPSGIWSEFKKIVNNRINGAFLINEVDDVNEIMYNRNIMQPLPYLLHILQQGMIDAGYILAGKILDDDLVKKITIYGDVDYYTSVEETSFYIYQMKPDAIETGEVICPGTFTIDSLWYWQNPTVLTNPLVKYRKYLHTLPLTEGGKYRISGQITIMVSRFFDCYTRIKYRNTIIWEHTRYKSNHFSHAYTQNYAVVQDIDIAFETLLDSNPNELVVESYQGDNWQTDLTIFDLDVFLVRLHDQSGNPLSTVINENKIDLTKAVPDILFDDIVKFVKNYLNYDFTKIVGNEIFMDPIEDNINFDTQIDLNEFNAEYPTRKYSQGNSFLLKFQDIDSKDYSFKPIFHSRDLIASTGYKTDDKTTTIEVAALPLPLLTRDGVQTAHAFESNNAKIYIVPYDGLSNGNNLSKPIDDYLIPEIHKKYWKKWFNFRINSVNYTWSFKTFIEKLDFTSKQKIYAYDQHHIIKSINRTEIAPNEFEVELETQSINISGQI